MRNQQRGFGPVSILLFLVILFLGGVVAMHLAEPLSRAVMTLALLAIVTLHIGIEQGFNFTGALNHLLTGNSDKPISAFKGKWVDGVGSWVALVFLILTGILPQVAYGILAGDALSHAAISAYSAFRRKGFWLPGVESVWLYALVVIVEATKGAVDFGSLGFRVGLAILLGNTALTVGRSWLFNRRSA